MSISLCHFDGMMPQQFLDRDQVDLSHYYRPLETSRREAGFFEASDTKTDTS